MNPLTADWYFAFNTRQPPFNNLKARQAVNFAADRNAYVKIGGGPSLAVPTCQILPPNFPGYKPYCPYTSGSGTTKWAGTDLAKARALVKASGTAGMKVVVNTDIPDKALGEQMVSDLNKIGYKGTLQVLAGSIQYPFIQNSQQLQEVEHRLVGLVPGLPGAVGLPERPARLRQHPPGQRRQPEHRRLLRPRSRLR